MVRNSSATMVDDLFFLAILLLFLMINYNMPLATIYTSIVYLTIFMYLVPILFNLFNWLPIYNRGKLVTESLVGVGAGVGFIWFYNYLQTTLPMSAVFATTAFGESVSMGRIVFGVLIPIIESVFFFVVLPLWALWKVGGSLGGQLLTKEKGIALVVFAAVFTIFHATSKGFTANNELLATFIFGAMSLGLVFYYKAALSAIVAHIVVNSKSVELFSIFEGSVISSSWFIIIGVIIAIFFIGNNRKLKFPFMAT